MIHSQNFEPAFSTGAPRERSRADGPVTPIYRVGEIFQRRRREWPEGAEFGFGPGVHELTLFHSEIGDELVDGVSRGPAEFALIVEPPLIVLAYRFGDAIPWSDVPYVWHLQPEGRRFIPDRVTSTEARSLLWITLVGARDGLIHAQRGMTLSPSFTQAIHDAIRAQAMSPFHPEGCTRAISRIYVKYPSMLDRLNIAAVRTMGNA